MPCRKAAAVGRTPGAMPSGSSACTDRLRQGTGTGPGPSDSHSACRNSGPTSARRPAPSSCDTDGGSAISVPIGTIIGSQNMAVPTATPASVLVPWRPAITLSTKPIRPVARWPATSGAASTAVVRTSPRKRAGGAGGDMEAGGRDCGRQRSNVARWRRVGGGRYLTRPCRAPSLDGAACRRRRSLDRTAGPGDAQIGPGRRICPGAPFGMTRPTRWNTGVPTPMGPSHEQAAATTAPATRPDCANCGAALLGEHCHACRQPVKGLVRHCSSLVGDVLDSVFDWDSRTPRTVWPLLARPGYLTLEYFAGRRIRYVSPFRLFFFIAVLTFFIGKLTLSFGPDNPVQLGGDSAIETALDIAQVEQARDQALARIAASRVELETGADAGGPAGRAGRGPRP